MSRTQTAPNGTAPNDGAGPKAAEQPPSPLRTLLRPIRGRIRTAVVLQGPASALGLVPLICLVELARALLADGADDTARAWLLVGVAAGTSVAALAAGTASTLVGHPADNDMQLSARRMSRVPLGWFTGRGSGRVKKAVHDDIEDVRSLVAHTLPDLAPVVTVPVIALVLEPGTVTALVGPSRAGKSTLAALLARFHDADTGSITVGGVDTREIADLYRSVGFVLQDVRLLGDTVADNIALGRPGATRERARGWRLTGSDRS